MSGIYSRSKYDECDYQNLKKISESVGAYSTSSDQVSGNRLCISGINPSNSRVGYISPNEFQNASLLTDMESHLKNIDIPLSNCMNGQVLSVRNERAKDIAKNFMVSNVVCNDMLNPKNTRLDLPAIGLREATTSRFDFPIIPPSSWFYNGVTGTKQVGNNRFGINSRLDAKDNFGFGY